MADERPAPDPVEAIADLQRRLDDLETTLAARILRRPTGDVEMTWRATPKDNTLIMQGQTVTRAAYPQLWAWVTEQALAGVGKPFGLGDGSTTFVLPDMRGRVPIGAGTLGPDTVTVGQLIGAARVTLAEANLPRHDHSFSIANHSNHSHTFNTQFLGSHNGHNDASGVIPPWTGGPTLPYGVEPAGDHSHGGETTQNSAGSHAWNATPFGSTSPTGLDVRQPGVGVNWLIWT